MNDVLRRGASERLSDAVYHAVFDEAADAIFVASSEGRYVAVNAQAEALTGYARHELIGMNLVELIDPQDLAATPLRSLDGQSMIVERRLRRKDGSCFDAELSASRLSDGKLLGFVRDVSRRKQLEAELRSSEARYRMAVTVAPDSIALIDQHGRMQMLSPAALTLFGYESAEELLGTPVVSVVAPADRERARMLFEERGFVLETRQLAELNLLRRDGSSVLCEVIGAAVPHGPGQPSDYLVYARDITERKQAEAKILHLSRLYALLSHVNQAVVRSKTQTDLFQAVCNAAVEQGGFRMAWIGMLEASTGRVQPVTYAGYEAGYLEQVIVTVNDEARGRGPIGCALRDAGFAKTDDIGTDTSMLPWREPALARGYRSVAAAAFRVHGRYVGTLTLYATEPSFFSHDECGLVREVAADISFALGSLEVAAEQERADAALRASHQRFQSLVQHSMDMIAMYAADGTIMYVSPAVQSLIGFAPEELLGKVAFELMHPDDRNVAQSEHKQLQTVPGATRKSERRYRHKNGEYRWLEVVATNLLDDPSVRAIVKNCRDITDRKRADEERQRLQAELSQAQKLESIGRLAGGVAHDFNNMLTVILGCAEAALDDLDDSAPLKEQLREVRDAALRSAELTRQLLTFARKQPYVPQVLDLNEIVPLTMKLLRRLIRENIELVWKPGPGLWATRLDRTQLEQLITNLTVNARDAIADAGQVLIETGNVSVPEGSDMPAGEYVRLTVRDTGEGIPHEIQAHIFEPFFTTKAAGQGTGLGLSTAYGIVQQSAGFIRVNSRPGNGSEFCVYLPRFAGAPQQKPKEVRSPLPPAARCTVLLVEDDPSVLALVRTLLQRLGHRVLTAASGQDALRVANEHSERIDLVLTDVVMPGMNGVDLMARLHAKYPALPCIFMSGYATDVLSQTRANLDEVVLLRKPFTIDALANALTNAERRKQPEAAASS